MGYILISSEVPVQDLYLFVVSTLRVSKSQVTFRGKRNVCSKSGTYRSGRVSCQWRSAFGSCARRHLPQGNEQSHRTSPIPKADPTTCITLYAHMYECASETQSSACSRNTSSRPLSCARRRSDLRAFQIGPTRPFTFTGLM
jgi:hypothetical protein